MKRLKPILEQSENGCLQFKAIAYNKMILQHSHIEDVTKYDIILINDENEMVASTNIHHETYCLDKVIINELIVYYNKHGKFPEYLIAKQINIYGNYEYATKGSLLNYDKIIDVEILEEPLYDKIINVANEIYKTISEEQFGYIMLPDLNGYKMFKIEKDRLEEYLAIESLRENNK